MDFEAEGLGLTLLKGSLGGQDGWNNIYDDGLSPWVLLVIIQQVFIEYLPCAWHGPGLSVLRLGKDAEEESRSPGIQGEGTSGRGDSQSQRTPWTLRVLAEAQGSHLYPS